MNSKKSSGPSDEDIAFFLKEPTLKYCKIVYSEDGKKYSEWAKYPKGSGCDSCLKIYDDEYKRVCAHRRDMFILQQELLDINRDYNWRLYAHTIFCILRSFSICTECLERGRIILDYMKKELSTDPIFFKKYRCYSELNVCPLESKKYI